MVVYTHEEFMKMIKEKNKPKEIKKEMATRGYPKPIKAAKKGKKK